MNARFRRGVRWIVGLSLALVVAATTALASGDRVDAQVVPSQWGLTSFCTPSQDFPQSRRFRVRNTSGVAQQATLRNQTTGQTASFVAPTGDSFQLVPANANPASANTTQLIVGGVTVQTKAANNKACSVLVGNAVCDTTTGLFGITWTVQNNGTGPSTVTATSIPGLAFTPNPIPANGAGTATEQVAGPASGTIERTLTLTVDLGSSVIGNPTATLTLGQCQRPIPPRIDFTFTKTPDVTIADVGDVVTYTYAGTNTGEVPLEITQLVDDRLGILITDPTVETIVPPGESISREVPYTVTANDGAIGRIENNAVATIRPRSGPDQTERTGTAVASVVVRPPPSPVLVGNVVCDPDAPGVVTITWTLANGGPGDAVILSSSRPGVLASGTVVPDGSLDDAEEVASPAEGTVDVALTVTVRGAPAVSATVTVAPCLAPVTDFTFTKTPSVTTAAPGTVITYTYAGTNTGTGPLEITAFVDDRLGIVLTDPDTETIVPPDGTISQSVQYTVTADDQVLGSIDNTAIATIVPTTGPDREPRTGAASATVAVPPPPPRPVPALEGNAVCVPEDEAFVVTWTLRNTGDGPAVVASASRPVTFDPSTVAPDGTATATETVPAPTDTATVALTVSVNGADPVSATVALGQCRLPPEPTVGFTFVKTADRPLTRAGETVTYTYTGTNTGDIPLEVTQLVDDRLGVLITEPDVETIVAPGGTIVRQLPYVVTLDDAAIGTIDNEAVASILPGDSEVELTALAAADVVVELVPDPVDPPDPDPTTTTTSVTTTTESAASTSTDAATTTTTRRPGTLPATGGSSPTPTVIALLVLGVGLVLMAVSSRPTTRRR